MFTLVLFWFMYIYLVLFISVIYHKQAFTNCVHGYDRARNVHANGITRTRKFVHVIDSSV